MYSTKPPQPPKNFALPPALAHLRTLQRWVIWRRMRCHDRDGWTKPPFQARHPDRYASTGDPRTWSTYEEAVAAAAKLGLRGSNGGIGFVFTDTDCSGFNLNKCVNDDGTIAPWATEFIRRCCNSYTEVSPGGTGVHILGLSENKIESDTLRSAGNGGRIQAWRNTDRYLTITGQQVAGNSELRNLDVVVDEMMSEDDSQLNFARFAARGRLHRTVIPLLTQEVLHITELTPDDDTSIGKIIELDGSITDYPTITWWKQRVAEVQATPFAVHEYLREARTRNVCLIRGAPANIERQRTRRQRAHEVHHGKDRGDHGFVDALSKLFPLDVDGAKIKWRDDPERAVKAVVAQLGEPWSETSFVWFLSATCGLERDKHKRWTGKIVDGDLRARIIFLTEHPLDDSEAHALTALVKVKLPKIKIDSSIIRRVQPNYIHRPLWLEHPKRDPLGDIETIGWVRGTREFLPIPADLTHEARWAKAQGHQVDIASHPNAEAAVRGICSDGRVRQHLQAAVLHLLRANLPPDVVSFADHAIVITSKLQKMLAQHRTEIEDNLARHRRHWAEVMHYLAGMPDWCHWCLDHQGILHAKTIKLIKAEPEANAETVITSATVFAWVARTIERACFEKRDPFEIYGDEIAGEAPVTLLVAPTGGGKSTEMHNVAVRFVTEHPDQTVCIFVPRHKLSDEHIKKLREEHPDANFSAAIWRGRQAWNPDIGNGFEETMCRRPDETKAVQDALLDVEHALCKQGRGEKVIKCPLYNGCAWQAQKGIEANIWFMAHEMLTQAPLKVFGKVGLVMIDESPLDAFIFGVDHNDRCVLALDELRLPPPNDDMLITRGREALYQALHPLRVPISRRLGVPPARADLHAFLLPTNTLIIHGWEKEHVVKWCDHDAEKLSAREWRNKVVPEITPTMTKEQIAEKLDEAAGNITVKQCSILFNLISKFEKDEEIKRCGRIQVQRVKKGQGREIRMVGLRPMGKGWSSAR